MRVGVVGSRVRDCESEVRALVRSFPAGTVVVSGGARGVDQWAADEARRCGLEVQELLPEGVGTGYYQACRGYTARNRLIAETVEILYVFVKLGPKKGGTSQTMAFARKRGIPVHEL
jgi:predicted Rossmann fold nucleotide-binding protein DprA/Smf involved in DNA uptake